MAGDQLAQLRRHGVLFRLRQGGDEAHRKEARDDHLLRRADMLVGEGGQAQRSEGRALERPTPVALVEARRVAFVGGDDASDLGDPIQRLVTHVPHQPQPAFRRQHAAHFLQRLHGGEPMEGLCAHQGVGEAVGQRNRLGATGQRLDLRQGFGKLGAHRIHRFHRDHSRAGTGQQAGELAGAGAEVHRDGLRTQAKGIAQPVGERFRVLGPALGVTLGLGAETLLGGAVYGRHEGPPGRQGKPEV